MLNKYGKDASVTAMVDKMDWVIMPVLNVDGYEYSHTRVSLFFLVFTSQGLVASTLGYLTTDKRANGMNV